MFFNTIFTFLPTILIGTFDQDMNDRISLKFPQIYQKGIRQTLYNSGKFWEFMAYAVYHSVICYFVGILIVNDPIIATSGTDFDLAELGTIISFSAIIVVNVFSVASWQSWTIITHIALWLSLALWVGYTYIYSIASGSSAFGIYQNVLVTPVFYLGVFLTIVVAMGPPFVLNYIYQSLYPTDTDIIRESLILNSKADCEAVGDVKPIDTEANIVPSNPDVVKSDGTLNKGKKRLPSCKKQKYVAANDGFGGTAKNFDPHEHPSVVAHLPIFNEDEAQKPSSVSSIGTVMKKAGDYVKQKFRKTKPTTLQIMGRQGIEVTNLGFAFSQDTGMGDMLTSPRVGPEIEKKFRESVLAVKPRLRQMSVMIQNALGRQLAAPRKGSTLPQQLPDFNVATSTAKNNQSQSPSPPDTNFK